MKRIISWTLSSILLLVIGGAIFSYVAGTGLNLLAFINFGKVETIEISGPTIVQAIQKQAKLETVAMNITRDTTIIKKHGVLDRCTEEITYIAYYQITAGLDLAAITLTDISEDASSTPKTFYITLPGAEILHNELDTANSRVVAERYPRWQPNCTRHTSAMVLEAQQTLRHETEASARQQGIIAMAEDHARVTLQELLSNAGISNVQIRFVPSSAR
jgi:hypothetical protein